MQIKDYSNIYDTEKLCLMCRHVCPVGRMTKREATTPHGWTMIASSVQRGHLQWDSETVDTLYQCADCGLCQADHPTDRPIPAAIVAARASVVAENKMPDAVTLLDEKLRRWGNPYGEYTKDAGAVKAGVEVGLFVGADTYFNRPQAIKAAEAILQAAGMTYALLGAGRSSVYLPYTVGLWDTARELGRQTVEELESADAQVVATLSKEDAHTFENVYPELDIPFPMNASVTEFVELLGKIISKEEWRARSSAGAHAIEGAVYHDPCHTARRPESSTIAREIIKEMAGAAPREMLWRGRSATPCGAIGGFEWTQPWLAKKLAKTRIEEAVSAGGQVLITEDPRCAAHLSSHSGTFPVVNLVELIAEGIKRA